jgi:hypothetical protein
MTPQLEHEPPPRRDHLDVIRVWLLNHPFIHFGIVLSYWLTGTFLLKWVWARWLHARSWTGVEAFIFATFMAIVFYFITAGRCIAPNGELGLD